ncbi:MAG: exodeoxyribonuclease VII small subunit [Bacillota bacterium]|jgi:exodeoxyribonuclease VII small subunit
MGDDRQVGEKISFEDALDRLEAIADALDEGKLSLQESMEIFEEAMDLVKRCRQILDSADGRIEQLIDLRSGMTEKLCLDDDPVE